MSSRSTTAPTFDHAAISGPLSCDVEGGSPAMIWARSLFIISVVKPGTGLCSHTPPCRSNSWPSATIAAPLAPELHCEMMVTRGFAGCARRRVVTTVAAVPANMARRPVRWRCMCFPSCTASPDLKPQSADVVDGVRQALLALLRRYAVVVYELGQHVDHCRGDLVGLRHVVRQAQQDTVALHGFRHRVRRLALTVAEAFRGQIGIGAHRD